MLKALEDIDNIIALIKQSESAAAAKVNLISKYNFTENQAKAILAMRLSSLAKLEKIELNKEAENLNEQILDLNKILVSKSEQISILRLRLENLVKKYGDPRKTELAQIEETKEEKAKVDVVPEDVVVLVNAGGDIKRVPKKAFKTQHRGGKGVRSNATQDRIHTVITTNTTDTLLCFTSVGKMYRLLVDKIPEGTNTSKGVNIKTILPFENNETIQAITALSEKNTSNVIFFTKKGLIKKTLFTEYSSMKKTTGIQAIKIKDDDELISVRFMDEEDVILITKNGNAIRVPTNDIKAIGRLTSGVKGINLKENDEVISALVIQNKDNEIAIITSAGKGKRLTLNNFVVQNRGGRGVNCIKLDHGDQIAAAAITNQDSSLLVIGKPNSICVPAIEFAEQSRTGMGVKIIERSIVHTMVKIS